MDILWDVKDNSKAATQMKKFRKLHAYPGKAPAQDSLKTFGLCGRVIPGLRTSPADQ